MLSRVAKITRLSISILIPLSISTHCYTEEPIVLGEHGRHLDTVLQSYADSGFSGAVLIAKDDEILLAKGYGLANREKNIPNSTDTVFSVGSITKQFTAAAILKLEMQRKLSVDDKISKYFGKLPRDKRKITIHHLPTHTSGLREQFGDDFSTVHRDDIIERALNNRLKYEVGERHLYSNAGYSLLGAIVEIASGQPYETYLRENLFLPADMQDTGYLLPQWERELLAIGYTENETWGTLLDQRWDTDGPYWNLRANGGIMSTVLDMYKWCRALQGDTILNADAKEKMFTRHVEEEPGTGWYYGYGWALTDTQRDTKLITHNGGNGIFFADFRWYIDEKVLIFFATNYADGLTVEMERGIRTHALIYPPKQ